jgi:hypothetical protein
MRCELDVYLDEKMIQTLRYNVILHLILAPFSCQLSVITIQRSQYTQFSK